MTEFTYRCVVCGAEKVQEEERPIYDKGPHNVAIVERAVVLADRLLSELEKGNG